MAFINLYGYKHTQFNDDDVHDIFHRRIEREYGVRSESLCVYLKFKLKENQRFNRTSYGNNICVAANSSQGNSPADAHVLLIY